VTTNARPQEGKPLSPEDILRNARSLAPWLRERGAAIEEARRLPDDVVARMRDAGLFRLNMPRLWGGPELTSMQQVEVIEEVSRGDASAGWCTMIGCDSGIYSGYLDDAVAREMYPRLDMVQAGWVYPVGQAERVRGGYKVSGNWMFGSGCTHSDWLAGGCIVVEDGSPALGADGLPQWRIMIAKPSEYEILDTWYTTGLCGSGSNDYRCSRLFVPEEHSFSFREPAKREGLLWARPDTLLRKMPGIPLGIARDAIDTVAALVRDKVEMPSFKLYRDLPRVQSAIAEAETLYGAARAYVYDSLAVSWHALEAGSEMTKAERANVWLARTNAFQSARRVVESMYDVIGGSAIYSRKSRLDRHLRDIQTICQHLVGQTKGWEMVGAMLLDAESGMPNPFL
jgi:indole-3-acetate monooxygenase